MDIAHSRRMMLKGRSRHLGFSLIELIVVVAIMFVASAVALPLIGSYIRNYQIKGATEKVASEIGAARGQAIKRNVNRGVVFTIISDTEYQYFIEDNPGFGDPTVSGQPTFVDVNHAERAPGQQYERLGGVRQRLPPGLMFAQVVGSGHCAMRFDRLGRLCLPSATTSSGSAMPTCAPDVPGGMNCSNTDYIFEPDATNGATIRINQTSTGLSRTVQVTPGGRVMPQQ